MFRTLYARLALSLASVLLVIGVAYAIISLSAANRYLDTVNQTVNRDLARNLVADRNLVRAGRLDEGALKQMFHDYMEINPSIEIYLLDRQGLILSYSADPDQVVRKGVALEPIRQFLAGAQRYPLLGDDPRAVRRRKAFSVTPVPSADTPEGYLYVVLRGEEFDAVDGALQDSQLLRLSAYALLVSLAFGLLVGLLVFRMLTRRLRRLSESIEQFRDTGFTTVPPVQSLRSGNQLDEVDRLTATFKLMAERIVAQLAELRHKDRDRRDMVANISHDLRTPLASMNGYLETLLLKADTFGSEQRQEYLAIALRHGQRLAGLIDDLFELANLQAAQSRPHREAVSIQDLVQDVTQKLGLRARDKGVALRAVVAGNVPLASADIGLIERVLDNLIANALDHSPRGGKVEIHVRGKGGDVVVAVTDEGEGIGSEKLPHIFDRYYRGEDRGTDHAGLGLAIVKQILALHETEITVDSKPGRGTTFTFALPAWRG